MEYSLNLDEYNTEYSIGTENNQDMLLNSQAGGFVWSNNPTTTTTTTSNTTSSSNNHKVLLAAKEGNFNVVSFMVKNGMVDDYSTTDSSNNSLLHYLAGGGNNKQASEVADIILKSNNVKQFINIQNGSGDTPLHVAVKKGHNEFAARLDECGCDPRKKNGDGFSVGVESEELLKGGGSLDNSLDNIFLMFNKGS